MSDQQTNLSGRDCSEKCVFPFCKLYETCQKNMDYECTIVHNFFTIWQNKQSECDHDCDICERGESSWGINGFGEVENVFLFDCGKTEEI